MKNQLIHLTVGLPHMFKADPTKALAIPGFTLNDNNVKKIGKLLIAYASQNYF